MKALITAIQRGDLEACRRLVTEDPQRAVATQEQGVSARLMALYCQRPEIAELLAQVGPPPGLLEAAALGNSERLESCLTAGEAADTRSADGFTPLHYGAFFGRSEVVERLLQTGVDVNSEATNGSGLKPLNSAVAGGHLQVVHRLLDHGADIETRQSGDVTPLMGAAAGGHDEIVELLLARGADRSPRCAAGKSAADYAEERGHRHLVARLTSDNG